MGHKGVTPCVITSCEVPRQGVRGHKGKVRSPGKWGEGHEGMVTVLQSGYESGMSFALCNSQLGLTYEHSHIHTAW